jgi:hypothetical protein
MQRRAAAMYFAFFVLIAIGAYGLIATTTAPTVSLQGPTYSQGDDVTLNERTYTVSEVTTEESGGDHGGGSAETVGTLTWTNDSAEYTDTLDNGSELAPTAIAWDGMQGRHVTTLEPGQAVVYNGTQYSVIVDNGTLTLTHFEWSATNLTLAAGENVTYQGTTQQVAINDSALTVAPPDAPSDTSEIEPGFQFQYNDTLYRVTTTDDGETVLEAGENTTTVRVEQWETTNETREEGDALTYRHNETTVTNVTSEGATLVWGDTYNVAIEEEDNETMVVLHQDRNVTQRLQRDPVVYNETVSINGTELVTYRANDTNRPLSTYLPDPERKVLNNGTELHYEGTQVTVTNTNAEGATITWFAPRENEVSVKEGGTFSVDGQQYFAHFEDDSSVQLLAADEQLDSYERQNDRIDAYEDRKVGLWGILELSGIAAALLLMTAYLPVRG